MILSTLSPGPVFMRVHAVCVEGSAPQHAALRLPLHKRVRPTDSRLSVCHAQLRKQEGTRSLGESIKLSADFRRDTKYSKKFFYSSVPTGCICVNK